MAEEIESTAFVTVNPKEQFSVTEVLIDEVTGNPVASEGVREFLRAAAEGKTIQDMCQAALEGSVSQIPDYLAGTMESSLQDAVTSLIGIDIFTPVNMISQWINPDQEPTALLQGVVEEQQKDYLFDLQIEIDSIYKVLGAIDPMWYEYSYSNEELLERWNKLAACYVGSVDFLVERGATLGQAPGFHTNGTGKYGGIEYQIYTKEFTAESRPVLITGGGRNYYYDMNGYLICMDAVDARITGRSFYMLSYLSKEAGAEIKTFWADGESPEIQRMNEQSLKAQELYSYFWNSGQR